MLTHTSTVTKRIEKARHFESSLTGVHIPDWQAVVYFYAALHWIGAAYEHQTGDSVPPSHRAAKLTYSSGHGVPARIFRAYANFQSFAEYVCYELEDPLEPEEIEDIAEQFQLIREWATRVLGLHEARKNQT